MSDSAVPTCTKVRWTSLHTYRTFCSDVDWEDWEEGSASVFFDVFLPTAFFVFVAAGGLVSMSVCGVCTKNNTNIIAFNHMSDIDGWSPVSPL